MAFETVRIHSTMVNFCSNSFNNKIKRVTFMFLVHVKM